MSKNNNEKNSALKIIAVCAIVLGALAGIAVTVIYFMKKFKLKLAMASPCDDCLAEDCSDCEFAADFDEAPIEDVDVSTVEDTDEKADE